MKYVYTPYIEDAKVILCCATLKKNNNEHKWNDGFVCVCVCAMKQSIPSTCDSNPIIQ